MPIAISKNYCIILKQHVSKRICQMVPQPSGKAIDCNSVITGSNPVGTSNFLWGRGEIGRRNGLKIRWELIPCGFKSHRSHHSEKQSLKKDFFYINTMEVLCELFSGNGGRFSKKPVLYSLHRIQPLSPYCAD